MKFYGDFFGPQDINQLAEKLQGVKYDHDEIAKVLEAEGTQQYITGIPTAEVADLLA